MRGSVLKIASVADWWEARWVRCGVCVCVCLPVCRLAGWRPWWWVVEDAGEAGVEWRIW